MPPLMAGDDSDKDKVAPEIDWSKMPARKPPLPEEIPEGNAAVALVQALTRSQNPPPPVRTDERLFPEIASGEYASWLTPDALLSTMPYGLVNHAQLERELRADRYRSAADEVIWIHDGFTGRDRLAILPAWIWSLSFPELGSDFWRTGYLDAWVPKDPANPSAYQGNFWRIYGVRFWAPNQVRPKEPEPVAPEVFTAPKGGRPPKPWWDDLWAEICRQVFVGELNPERQAEVERAMLDWAVASGESLSEPSARLAARKLVQAIKAKG
jgi:hypothetical protein